MARLPNGPPKGIAVRVHFDERELQIIRWIADGKPFKWIYPELGISKQRYIQLLATIRGKAGVESGIGLVRFAIRKGIVKP
jgi:DNA-binding CsgD family transcriptional regulator